MNARRVFLRHIGTCLAILGTSSFTGPVEALQAPHGDSFLYYVMPLIDGDALRDKLNRQTQLGIDDAVKITTTS